MKKTFILLAFTFGTFLGAYAQSQPNPNLKKCTASTVNFFSSTALENIDATSTSSIGLLETEKKTFVFKIPNISFRFKNQLMEEHFNEKYMETPKYNHSTFSGKINEAVDFSKDGVYELTATGKLNIHGVELPRTVNVKATVKDGKITFVSEFDVKVADHKIEIPSLVASKIAESVHVKVNADF